jgi:hypothetical protein
VNPGEKKLLRYRRSGAERAMMRSIESPDNSAGDP